jgi:azurin
MRALLTAGIPLALFLACSGGDSGGTVQTVTLTPVGNEMKYATTEITAKAGSRLRVVMENTATQDDMHHNFTLLDAPPSDEETIQEVGMAAIQLGEAGGWLPNLPSILAHTPIALPGETTEVIFKVPPAGDYAYICTYNAHYATMRGTLHAQ